MHRRFAVIYLLLFAVSAFAQSSTSADAACGAKDIKAKVETQDSEPASASTANLTFIEDQLVARPGAASCMHCGVPVLWAVDGVWITGTQGFSHSSVSLSPGKHHVCAKVFLGGEYVPAMFGFDIEPNKHYFLIGRLSIAIGSKSDILELYEPNVDQGKYLATITKPSYLVTK